MKNYKVCVPVDYLRGHLRYGHAIYSIEAETKEEAIQKLKSTKEIIRKMENGEIPDDPDFEDFDYEDVIIDDWCIDDLGDFQFNEAYIEEKGDI